MSARAKILWGTIALIAVVPLIAVGFSPQLAWRDPIYIASGFAGVIALSTLLVQPLLAGAYPVLEVAPRIANRFHKTLGVALFGAIVLHVVGLYLTSPLDVIDVFLLRSPTPFSIWGLLAFFTVLAAFVLAMFRRRLRWRPKSWRMAHVGLAMVTVIGTVVHTVLIEGTMEPFTKTFLCVAVVFSTALVFFRVRIRNTLGQA